MKGYKTIDQFDMQECDSLLKSFKGSQYDGIVKQRYSKLQEEQQVVAQMKRQREQQEMYEIAAKASRRRTRNGILLTIFLILVIAAGILIYITYTN